MENNKKNQLQAEPQNQFLERIWRGGISVKEIITNDIQANQIRDGVDGQLFAQILNRHHASVGFKTEIDDLAKQEIIDYLKTDCKGLTLFEIDLALKNERKGVWERSEHYQLFNLVYFSDIIKKYKDWKIYYKSEHNIPVAKQITTTVDKEKIEKEYWESVYNEVKEKGYSERFTKKDFDKFLEMGLIPKDIEGAKKLYQSELTKLKNKHKTYDRTKSTRVNIELRKIAELEEPNFIERVKKRCRNITMSQCLYRFETLDDLLTKINTNA